MACNCLINKCCVICITNAVVVYCASGIVQVGVINIKRTSTSALNYVYTVHVSHIELLCNTLTFGLAFVATCKCVCHEF